MSNLLRDTFSTISSSVEARLFAEYGAVFVTSATPPPVLIFTDAAEVEQYQLSLPVKSALLGEHKIELQSEALVRLTQAAAEIEARGGRITARASDSGRRSFDETTNLWNRNLTRGLEHWQNLGRMDFNQAREIREAALTDQIAIVLDIEEASQLYFGTYFDRTILSSVAAPGASQHLSMLAFDVAEFQDEQVEGALNHSGWFRTVVNDLPHFTFLGRSEDELPSLGLKQYTCEYGSRNYLFWIPDLEALR